jgi:flagellar biosynthesis/type III secretory pathway chaperone
MSAGTPSPGAIATANDAEIAVTNLEKIMDELEKAVSEETSRVRAGRLRDAIVVEQTKSEFARLYAVESGRVKAAKDTIARLAPKAFARLRERHDALQGLLQTNLTVLATAHAVSEGIIRGVSGELARRQAPSTYGASGRAQAPSTKASPPLAISRTL